MSNADEVLKALNHSSFRRKFKLGIKESRYLKIKGLPTVVEHAKELVAKRLAPANPPNDGKQTPFRGHPVFIAQHATATCCRTCLEKWHAISQGHALSEQEQEHVIETIEKWLCRQIADDLPGDIIKEEKAEREGALQAQFPF